MVTGIKTFSRLLVLSVLILIGLPGSSSAQEGFDYGERGTGIQILLDTSKDAISLSSDDESQVILDVISSSFDTLAATIPISHDFHFIVDEAITLKNNNQFEESLAKYQLALDSYDEWYYSDDVDESNFSIVQEELKITNEIEPDVPKTIEPKTEEDGGGCLIATATYGSELAPQVQQLRELRDNSLLHTESGSAFVKSFNQFYYLFSPAVADLERENPVFKEAVKVTLIPMLSSLSLLNYVEMDSEDEVLGYGISVILLNIGMYLVMPAIVVYSIRCHICSKRSEAEAK